MMARRLIGAERRAMGLAIAAAMLVTIASILLLALSGWFLTGAGVAASAGIAAIQAFNYLLPSAAIRLFAIVRTIGRYGERLYSHRAALKAMARLRASLFSRIARAPVAQAFALVPGDATARLIDAIDGVEEMVVRRPARPAAIVATACGLALSASAGLPPAVVLATIVAAVAFGIPSLARRWLLAPAHDAQAMIGELKRDLVEHAAASADIAVYGLAERISADAIAKAGRLDAARRRLLIGEAKLGGLLTVAGGVAVGAVILLAEAAPAIVALAALGAAATIEALGAMVRGDARAGQITAGMARIEALNAMTREAASDLSLPGHHLRLIVDGAAQDIWKGERIALIGRSGVGKTRLLETLCGLHPDRAAGFAIDGRDLAHLGPRDLRTAFAISPQDARMITGTLADNLRLACPGISVAEMDHALAVACFDQDVARLPGGLDGWIGDGGTRLSGGQRKRVSLARALLARRPWLFLDEPSDGLDAATEALLIDRLTGELDRTGTGLLLVTHRPAMLALTPRIMQLNGCTSSPDAAHDMQQGGCMS